MINATLKSDQAQFSNMKSKLLLIAPGSSDKSIDSVIKCLKETQELYLNTLEYLSKSYVLFQPSSVRHFRSSKTTKFWAYTAESLFDCGVISLCNLLDENASIGHKNIRKLIKNISLLKNLSCPPPTLNTDVESIYLRVKNKRDRHIAHGEYRKEASIKWTDPILLANAIQEFLVDFYEKLLDLDFSLSTLGQIAFEDVGLICAAAGLNSCENDIRNEVVAYFQKFSGITQ